MKNSNVDIPFVETSIGAEKYARIENMLALGLTLLPFRAFPGFVSGGRVSAMILRLQTCNETPSGENINFNAKYSKPKVFNAKHSTLKALNAKGTQHFSIQRQGHSTAMGIQPYFIYRSKNS